MIVTVWQMLNNFLGFITIWIGMDSVKMNTIYYSWWKTTRCFQHEGEGEFKRCFCDWLLYDIQETLEETFCPAQLCLHLVAAPSCTGQSNCENRCANFMKPAPLCFGWSGWGRQVIFPWVIFMFLDSVQFELFHAHLRVLSLLSSFLSVLSQRICPTFSCPCSDGFQWPWWDLI